jgi:hypothetical protein
MSVNRASYADVFAWVAAQPDGVRMCDMRRHLAAHYGYSYDKAVLDSFLTAMENNGYLFSECDGRVFAFGSGSR